MTRKYSESSMAKTGFRFSKEPSGETEAISNCRDLGVEQSTAQRTCPRETSHYEAIHMILHLDDASWDHIIEGLDLRANQLAECGEIDEAGEVRSLIKSLEQLGDEVLGGKIEGYSLNMKSHRGQIVKIRIVVEIE